MKNRARRLTGLLLIIAPLIGARAPAQEEPGCENELLTDSQIRQSMARPSRGVEEPHARYAAKDKRTLKTEVEKASEQQRPARPTAPSRETIRAQSEYLAAAERLKREHTGTDEELQRALRSAKSKILGSYER